MALQFPTDLTQRYYFDLKFVKYNRPNPYTGQVSLGTDIGAIFAADGSGNIRLPVPSNLIDKQNLVWQQAENVGGALEVMDFLTDGNPNTGMEGMLAPLGKAGAQVLADISKAISQQGAVGRAIGDPVAYGLQKTGLAINPVLTQMFKHPEFKEHAFSWVLAPETANESYIAQQIIDTIRQQSLPGLVAGGAFFSYPSIAMVQIHTGNNGNLYNFQPSVITSVTTNFAPKGVPSFFAGTNAPTLIELQITLLEIILNTRDNFKGGNVSGFDFSLGGLGSNILKQKGLEAVRKLL